MRRQSIVGLAVLTAACTLAARPVAARPVTAPTTVVIDSLNLEGVNVNALTGTLTATGGTVTGTLGGLPFTTDINDFTLTPAPGNGRRCSVLHLDLAPIDIALLGLFVDTSEICLDITAFQGQGLLGDLLCGLAGGDLSLLDSLDLLSGLSNILTTALERARNTSPGQGGGSVCTGECEVLDLVLGPLTLNLLGVQVKLDDCANGPVEICVSASASGGLLGEVLCGLTDGGLLDGITLGGLLDLIGGLLGG
jgi:hypothetical protein